MKMKRTTIPAGIEALLLFFAALPLAVQADAPTPSKTPVPALPAGLDEGFAGELDRALGAMLEDAPLPARSLETVLGQLRGEWLPTEPAEAALMIYAAASEADLALRRGVPAQEIKSRIRQEWQALRGQVHEFAISRQLRRSGELDEFLRESRRAFMEGRGSGAGWNDFGRGSGR
jgi:hypothetical protein